MDLFATDFTIREVLFLVAIPFVVLGVGAAVFGIIQHVRAYNKPKLQRYEVRILTMIPVYIILTWLPLYYVRAIRYYRMARDFFQGFFVASFFQLIVEYLGGEDETVAVMALKEPIDNGKCCFCGPQRKPTTFDDPFKLYLKYKRGAMQFTLVMPLIALATMILDFYDVYNNGEFNPAKSYVWLQVIRLVSAVWSMFSLKGFLGIMEDELERLNVQAKQKFLCIQGVILGLLLQGILISIIFNWVSNDPLQYTSEDIANFVAICEMTFVAFAHSIYFSYKDFEPSAGTRRPFPLSRAMTDSLLPVDYVHDLAYVFSKKPEEKRLQKGTSNYGTLQDNDSVSEIPQALPGEDSWASQTQPRVSVKSRDEESGQ